MSTALPPAEPSEGTEIGPYRVISRLGRGGGGEGGGGALLLVLLRTNAEGIG